MVGILSIEMRQPGQRSVMFYLGAVGLVFTAVVWLITNRLEPYLLGAFLALMGIGEGSDALKEFKQERKNGE